MTTMGYVRRGGAVLGLLAAISTAAAQPQVGAAKKTAPTAVAKEDSGVVAKKDDATAAKKDEGQVKTFELKSGNPGEIQQFLAKHFAAVAQAAASQKGPAKAPVLIAYDARSKTLFVRGAAADVETAGKIIAQLEGGADAANGPLYVIRLKNASVEETVRVLTALNLAARVYPCQASRMLILPKGDPDGEQVKAVVDKLDAGAKEEAAPKATKTEPAPKGTKVETATPPKAVTPKK